MLIGMMGTGKSVVGKVLEEKTGLRRFDTDEVVSSKSDMPVNEIFSTHGEGHFRDLETETLRSMSLEEPAIIVTGGGARRECRPFKATWNSCLVGCRPGDSPHADSPVE